MFRYLINTVKSAERSQNGLFQKPNTPEKIEPTSKPDFVLRFMFPEAELGHRIPFRFQLTMEILATAWQLHTPMDNFHH
jgi:hypothetical protein